MRKKRFLGLWLDELVAHLIEFRNNITIFENVVSGYGIYKREQMFDRRKKFSLDINWLSDYLHNLKNELVKYDRVVLFGPPKMRRELYKQLRSNKKFRSSIVMDSRHNKTMSEKQMDDFVRNYFGGSVLGGAGQP